MSEEADAKDPRVGSLIEDLGIYEDLMIIRKWQSIDMDVVAAQIELIKPRRKGLKLSFGIYAGCKENAFQLGPSSQASESSEGPLEDECLSL